MNNQIYDLPSSAPPLQLDSLLLTATWGRGGGHTPMSMSSLQGLSFPAYSHPTEYQTLNFKYLIGISVVPSARRIK